MIDLDAVVDVLLERVKVSEDLIKEANQLATGALEVRREALAGLQKYLTARQISERLGTTCELGVSFVSVQTDADTHHAESMGRGGLAAAKPDLEMVSREFRSLVQTRASGISLGTWPGAAASRVLAEELEDALVHLHELKRFLLERELLETQLEGLDVSAEVVAEPITSPSDGFL